MPFHLIAYEKSITTAGTLQAITPVPDPTVTINGNHVLVPDKYNQVVGHAGITDANALTQAQLQSPSLREMFFPDVRPLVLATTFSNVLANIMFGDNPLPLKTNEGLDFYTDGGGDGTTAQLSYGLVWLADQPLKPVMGPMFKMRATASIQAAVGAWTNGALTFDQTLPVGKYQIVGMTAQGVGLKAARLVFIGDSAVTRPGCPAVNAVTAQDANQFKKGGIGVYGVFDSTTPPSVDVIGGTGTAQVFEFDLLPAA